jgi:D-glycero-D-manno-heptose 1,7-bisphosphate phosphatase
MPIKTIFLDRDGVINKERSYLYKITDFEFIDGIFDACLNFISLGYKIIIVTNQSGISRGFYSENDFKILNKWMLDQFQKKEISILDIFYCPHGPESNCDCRKPKPGMFLKAKNKYNINLEKSWMIGDTEADIKAASSCGIKNTILVRSGHKIDESKSNAKFILDSIERSKNIII